MQYIKVNPKVKQTQASKVGKWETKPTIQMPQITVDMLVSLSK